MNFRYETYQEIWPQVLWGHHYRKCEHFRLLSRTLSDELA